MGEIFHRNPCTKPSPNKKETRYGFKTLLQYYNNVYNPAHRKTEKHKGEGVKQQSIRSLNKKWKSMKMPVKAGQPIPVDSLLDIGRDMQQLTGNEKIFYEDQLSNRECRLSQEVDLEFEEDREQILNEMLMIEEENMRNESYALGEECPTEPVSENNEVADSAMLKISCNRSVLARSTVTVVEKETQTDLQEFTARPKIRKVRDCTSDVKSTCAEVSVKCNVSAQMSRVAVQTVCKGLYKHEFYLTKEEAKTERKEISQEHLPVDEQNNENVARPVKKEDYADYEFVLPSTKTIVDYKQLLSIQHEKDAALALKDIPEGIKVTLHYDTTQRSKIDGDWPCLILIFSDKRRFSLRPLLFAYEDRENIIKLFVETFKRLSLTLETLGMEAKPKDLWENVTAIMTDSVAKNLKIEHGIAELLNSDHIPLHLLCKSHVVEALDRSNLEVLASVEKKLCLREKLESINPALKSFMRGEKSVAVCGIKTILNFVSHDKSASSTNQAELFDTILQREKQVKHMSIYHERRFTKLGFSAASILNALPYLRMLVNESHLSNQHIEAVRLFLDSEFFITELVVLSYFTHRVSLPLLNCVEISSQPDLLKILPQLFSDLTSGKLDTLEEFLVVYNHIKINEPTSETEKMILEEMCHEAAKSVERQCGREYGFGTIQGK